MRAHRHEYGTAVSCIHDEDDDMPWTGVGYMRNILIKYIRSYVCVYLSVCVC